MAAFYRNDDEVTGLEDLHYDVDFVASQDDIDLKLNSLSSFVIVLYNKLPFQVANGFSVRTHKCDSIIRMMQRIIQYYDVWSNFLDIPNVSCAVYLKSIKAFCERHYSFKFPCQMQLLFSCELPFLMSLDPFAIEIDYDGDFRKIRFVTNHIESINDKLKQPLADLHFFSYSGHTVGYLFELVIKLRYEKMVYWYLRDRMLYCMQLERYNGIDSPGNLIHNFENEVGLDNNEDVIGLGDQSKSSSDLIRKRSNVFLNHNQSGSIREFIIDTHFCLVSASFLNLSGKMNYLASVACHLKKDYRICFPDRVYDDVDNLQDRRNAFLVSNHHITDDEMANPLGLLSEKESLSCLSSVLIAPSNVNCVEPLCVFIFKYMLNFLEYMVLKGLGLPHDYIDHFIEVDAILRINDRVNLCPCRATCLVYCDGSPDDPFMKFFETQSRVDFRLRRDSKRIRTVDDSDHSGDVSEY